MNVTKRCPTCERALRIPDTLLGKEVKCRGCQNIFVAGVEDKEYRPRPSSFWGDDEEDEDDKKCLQRRRDEDDRDDEDEDEDEDDFDDTTMESKKNQTPRTTKIAIAMCKAFCVAIAGALGTQFGGWIGGVIAVAIGAGLAVAADSHQGDGGGSA